MPKLAVLVSGAGTNFEAILKYPLPVAFVIADRECRALDMAIDARLPHLLLKRVFGKNFDREKFTIDILGALESSEIDAVAMAGFMTVLSPVIFTRYHGRILNTHPSLLPNFKGGHAVEDALRAGAKVTGCTIHIATAELDEGPIIAQQEVLILDGDTDETLHARIKNVEHELYPKTIDAFLRRLPNRLSNL
ncbi:MAG: phosphoribosylglycinamide formyltransferase [Parcubacteria group bacterium]|nr:phosphoribosylglycinamide formyltransferase [Parcubacteria group bacterium]